MAISRIFLQSPITGGLGNQLFQINLLVQLAMQFGLTPVFPKSQISSLCVDFKKTLHIPKLRQKLFLSQEILREESLTEIGKLIDDSAQNRQDILVAKSVLGEVLHKFYFKNPKEIFEPAKQFCHYAYQNFSECVALHFRGSDFLNWDSTAIMNLDYYDRAINSSSLIHGREGHLFTDDPSHEVVRTLLKKFKNIKLKSSGNQFDDFWRISNYSEVIATPSTFVLWAAMLGKSCKILIDRHWIENRLTRGEEFWITVAENRKGIFGEVLLV